MGLSLVTVAARVEGPDYRHGLVLEFGLDVQITCRQKLASQFGLAGFRLLTRLRNDAGIRARPVSAIAMTLRVLYSKPKSMTESEKRELLRSCVSVMKKLEPDL